VIDGQHRLAGLEVLGRRQPDTLEKVDVPCVIFDKSQADFAVEMFVIINSTPTRLNRSHLIALYDRLQRSTPVEKAAAKAVALGYGETDSPLHRKVDMLGRRRRTERWIRQASLFRELVRLAEKNEKLLGAEPNAKAIYEVMRDFLRAVRKVFAEAWDNPRYHVSTDVTLMAMIRVLGDYLRSARGARTFEAVERQRAFENLIEPWARMVPEFREEGFYERFAARGQVERISVIQRALANAIGVGARASAEWG
jgi:DGQHR domain-containing protein